MGLVYGMVVISGDCMVILGGGGEEFGSTHRYTYMYMNACVYVVCGHVKTLLPLTSVISKL